MNERIASDACERVRGRLDRLLDRELSPIEEARDQGHLESCAACAEERERSAAFFEALGAEAAGLDFALEGLQARLAATPGNRLRLRLLRQNWMPAAAVAAAGLLTLAMLRGTDYADQGLLAARNVPGKELREAFSARPDWMIGIERLLGED